MGKSSSQANTTTKTDYTTTTNTTVGLTGNDVNQLVTTFANFALATESQATQFSNHGVDTNSPYPADDTSASSPPPPSNPLASLTSNPLVLIGILFAIFMMVHK